MNDMLISRQMDEYYTSFNSINNLYAMWAKKKGITYHTLFILYAIYHSEEGCRQKTFSEDWLIPKQTSSTVLKGLEKAGYILYLTETKDRRNKIVAFTEKGLGYAKPILDELYALEESVLEQMGADVTKQLIDSNRSFYLFLKKALTEDS